MPTTVSKSRLTLSLVSVLCLIIFVPHLPPTCVENIRSMSTEFPFWWKVACVHISFIRVHFCCMCVIHSCNLYMDSCPHTGHAYKSHALFVVSNTSQYVVWETRLYDSCMAHVSPLLPTCHSHRVRTAAGLVAVRQIWSSLWRPRTIPWTSRSSWKNWRYVVMVDKMVGNWRGGELWKRWTSHWGEI